MSLQTVVLLVTLGAPMQLIYRAYRHDAGDRQHEHDRGIIVVKIRILITACRVKGYNLSGLRLIFKKILKQPGQQIRVFNSVYGDTAKQPDSLPTADANVSKCMTQ